MSKNTEDSMEDKLKTALIKIASRLLMNRIEDKEKNKKHNEMLRLTAIEIKDLTTKHNKRITNIATVSNSYSCKESKKSILHCQPC